MNRAAFNIKRTRQALSALYGCAAFNVQNTKQMYPYAHCFLTAAQRTAETISIASAAAATSAPMTAYERIEQAGLPLQ